MSDKKVSKKNEPKKSKKSSKGGDEILKTGYFAVSKRNYEMMIIIDAEVGQKKIDEKIKDVKNLIESEGGKITFEDLSWGVRDLCYKIKNRWTGLYVLLNFEIDSDKLRDIDSQLLIDGGVLRHLIVKLPDGYSPITYTEIKAKYESIESNKNLKRRSPTVKPKEAPVVIKVEKEIEKMEEVVVPVMTNIVEQIQESKEALKEEVKLEEKTEKENESDNKDHLDELNKKLDKLLLSDDLDNI